jgi:hypothetical protein
MMFAAIGETGSAGVGTIPEDIGISILRNKPTIMIKKSCV